MSKNYTNTLEETNKQLLEKLEKAEQELSYYKKTSPMTQLTDRLKKDTDYARGFYDNYCCCIFDDASSINNNIDESKKIAQTSAKRIMRQFYGIEIE